MLTLVPTPIGNLGDITFRALEALKDADVILCEDTRVAKRLLRLLEEKFQLSFTSKKFISFYEHNQHNFLVQIDPNFFEQRVVYISDAGMPGISDPGAELIRYAKEHRIAYSVLPGPTAFVTAYVASGFGGRFLFWGFLPHKGAQRERELQTILESAFDVVLYEAPHRLERLLEEIALKEPQRELFLAKELTKLHERYFFGIASDLLERLRQESVKGEWVVVVKAQEQRQKRLALTKSDIMALSLPKKEKAKLLARVTEKSVKEWYAILNDS